MWTFYKANKMRSCSRVCYLAQAKAKQAKSSGEEAATEKKLRQEALAEEAVFQEEKQWHSVAGVGCSAGKWSLKRMTKTGVWKSVLVAGCDSEEPKSWAVATEVILEHDWVVQDIWCDWDKKHVEEKNVWVGRKWKLSVRLVFSVPNLSLPFLFISWRPWWSDHRTA